MGEEFLCFVGYSGLSLGSLSETHSKPLSPPSCIKTVPRHCQMSPWGRNCLPSQHTTGFMLLLREAFAHFSTKGSPWVTILITYPPLSIIKHYRPLTFSFSVMYLIIIYLPQCSMSALKVKTMIGLSTIRI